MTSNLLIESKELGTNSLIFITSKTKNTLNELYVEQEIIANGLIENLRTIEDNFTPDEK